MLKLLYKYFGQKIYLLTYLLTTYYSSWEKGVLTNVIFSRGKIMCFKNIAIHKCSLCESSCF